MDTCVAQAGIFDHVDAGPVGGALDRGAQMDEGDRVAVGPEAADGGTLPRLDSGAYQEVGHCAPQKGVVGWGEILGLALEDLNLEGDDYAVEKDD